MFTGDRSGDVLYAALHAVGLASQPTAVSADDGLELYGVRITAPVKCAPPENKPTPAERDNCRPWLAEELALLRADAAGDRRARRRSAGRRCCRCCPPRAGGSRSRARSSATARTVPLDGPGAADTCSGCYHVSQQNTFTGRLTPAMVEDVLTTAKKLAGIG